MPAQEGEKPQAKESAAKTETKAPKDDAITAKDIAIVAIDEFIEKQKVDKKSANWRMTLKAPPKQKFDDKSDYFWHLETMVGPLKIQFYPDTAPMHVTNGIYLSRLGFYDGLKFHRREEGFVIQGGDPKGDGTGGPGYQIKAEFNKKPHVRGAVAMARSSDPNSAGSQFYICLAPANFLDGQYTVFGIVTKGMDVVDKVRVGDTMKTVKIVEAQ